MAYYAVVAYIFIGCFFSGLVWCRKSTWKDADVLLRAVQNTADLLKAQIVVEE